MAKEPLAPVMLVSALAYSSISAIGTCARMVWAVPRASVDCTRPRRCEMSPMTSPTCWSGADTSTSMMGSRSVGLACSIAALKP